MATIVRGTVPADELALNHTLSELPDLEIECERVVKSGEDVIMPLLWVRHGDHDEIDAVLDADPTVDEVNCLSTFDDEYLYRMTWTGHVHLLVHMLTNGEATVLDAYGRKDRWTLRVVYPDRDHLSGTHDFIDEHGLTFDVESIRELDGEPAGRFGLTERQYRALVEATEGGYYDVPRRMTLEELAADLDVSHQALSETLRRGIEALVEDTLVVGTVSDDS
jgi:predicted DNA binding protein